MERSINDKAGRLLKNLSEKPKVVDLFSGAGGLSSGFTRAGYEVIGAVENWAPAANSLKENHPHAYVETGDIRSVDAKDFLSNLKCRPNVVLGGPSCQGFSTSGGLSRITGRCIDDERNSLFIDFIRFVDALQPEWVVMENVPGLLMFKRGEVAKEVIKQFRLIGYHVAPMILLAADFGVPQLRRRVIFVGNRTGAKIPFPIPSHGNPELWKKFALPFAHLSRIGNKAESTQLKPHVSFSDACSDLPPIEPGGSIDSVLNYLGPSTTKYQKNLRNRARNLHLHYSFHSSDFTKAAMEHLAPGQNWTNLPPELKIGRYAKIRPYDATTLLRRLLLDQPAYTINTKFNDATTGAYIHPVQNRTLSLREAARIQSFPDAYVFNGSPANIRIQIGNAVPPLLGQKIAEAMKSSVLNDLNIVTSGEALTPHIEIDPYQDLDDLIGLKPLDKKKKIRDQSQPDLFAT